VLHQATGREFDGVNWVDDGFAADNKLDDDDETEGFDKSAGAAAVSWSLNADTSKWILTLWPTL